MSPPGAHQLQRPPQSRAEMIMVSVVQNQAKNLAQDLDSRAVYIPETVLFQTEADRVDSPDHVVPTGSDLRDGSPL